jgi:5-methyltetrahydropteroyltriglutamate--homocysteine methyltransferase
VTVRSARPKPPPIGATVLGYPRIGPRRELKKALEAYWAGRLDETGLRDTAQRLRAETWRELSGLDSIPGNTFSYYDQVLDTAVMVDAVPDRYRNDSDLATYFAMARGTETVAPLEMTKWFDTNYHYLVPEIGPATAFRLANRKPVDEFREALALGITTRPVLVGPVTFLLLSKAPDGYRPLDKLDELIAVYAELLGELHRAGAEWVQLDEPAFAADRTPAEIEDLRRTYAVLGALTERPALLVAGYFGEFGDALPALARTPVEGIALDLVSAPAAVGIPALRDKTLVAGVVDGRNIWRTDLDAALGTAATLFGIAGEVAVSTSCSLLHVPYDVEPETELPDRLKSWLAFARQKVAEVVVLGRALREGRDAVATEMAEARAVVEDRARQHPDGTVRARLDALRPNDTRRGPYADRAAAQSRALRLPPLPTTTIGSFPQTPDIRSVRARYRRGEIGGAAYEEAMRSEIARVLRLQEDLGLDVLVHGEPERNDMVQYFAEQLTGFAATELGWVQSYGSRCVRPPILYGDVARVVPMTVPWATYAQSLTDRPVKGMLTGPVTILAWSFVRDDQPLADTARQVALAIRDEVRDLEASGIRIIQVDEPALRELLPLRQADRKAYLDWAVEAFRLATSGISDSTQIHTHMCYSEFGEIVPTIEALDADVTSIEAARSGMELLSDLRGFGRAIGPGVYDIHSPRVPEVSDIELSMRSALEVVPADRLWVNPDCGLKTRGYAEVVPALRHLVAATRSVRSDIRTGYRSDVVFEAEGI